MSTIDFTNLNPENKNRTPEEEKDLPDISLRGEVEFKKPSWTSRTWRNAKKILPFMFWQVAVPEMGRALWNALVEGAEKSIFGSSSARRSSSRGTSVWDRNVVEYNDYYDKRNVSKTDRDPDVISGSKSYDEFLFSDRMDCDDILVALIKQAKADDKVSVADLYYIIKRVLKKAQYPNEIIALLETPQFTDNDYGWYYEDLRSANVGHCRTNGRTRYFLDLPEAVPIKRR